jgi:BirA family transcriptional regulator, biotin operon repressor / biotin---[acetyl-CoA-carboxylase] ligase
LRIGWRVDNRPALGRLRKPTIEAPTEAVGAVGRSRRITENMTQPVALDWEAVAEAVANQLVGRRLIYLPATASTNDDVRGHAQRGEAEGLVVVADAQTAGRGRAGKSPWLTPPFTSIAVSVLLRPRLCPAELPLVSMAAGVAVIEALQQATGITAVLKWPNDVLIRGRKVGGILVESAVTGSGVTHAVVGIGLNGNLPSEALGPFPDAAVPATTLQDSVGMPISREAVLIALLRSLENQYGAIRAGNSMAIWHAYKDVLSTLGQRVRLRLSSESQEEGIAEEVTPSGELILRLPTGERRAFAHGEVSLRLG